MSNVKLLSVESGRISPDINEALRYMGVPCGADASLISKVAEIRDLVSSSAVYKACYCTVEISRFQHGIRMGNILLEGKSIAKNLSDCNMGYLFCATAGIEVDRLIARLGAVSPAMSLIADAVGSAAIEAFCDHLNGELGKNCKLRPRFSPGYGDLPLECQKDIITALGAPKLIGVSLTDSLMMTPVKSVTAVIGIMNN